jgi:hypothetical protein
MRRWLLALLVCATPARAEIHETPAPAADAAPAPCRSGSRPYSRVELYLGGAHADAAWRDFLAKVVTPRFPDGLTVIEGAGQWRGPRGIERERSRVIVILYQPDATSDRRVEAIREAYKARFKQHSVLRVDSTACVSF